MSLSGTFPASAKCQAAPIAAPIVGYRARAKSSAQLVPTRSARAPPPGAGARAFMRRPLDSATEIRTCAVRARRRLLLRRSRLSPLCGVAEAESWLGVAPALPASMTRASVADVGARADASTGAAAGRGRFMLPPSAGAAARRRRARPRPARARRWPACSARRGPRGALAPACVGREGRSPADRG